MYQFLDYFFLAFHCLLIAFNLVGWLWHKTRRLNLLVLLATAGSWLVLGIWYGIGYCPFTDWHWQVRARLGYADMPNSYIKFLVDEITGWDTNAVLVDVLTGTCFAAALVASAWVNFNDFREKRKGKF